MSEIDPRMKTTMLPAMSLYDVVRQTLLNDVEKRQQVLNASTTDVYSANIMRTCAVPMRQARLVLDDILAEEAAAIITRCRQS